MNSNDTYLWWAQLCFIFGFWSGGKAICRIYLDQKVLANPSHRAYFETLKFINSRGGKEAWKRQGYFYAAFAIVLLEASLVFFLKAKGVVGL